MVQVDQEDTQVDVDRDSNGAGTVTELISKKKRRRRRKPRLTGLSKQRQTANARERQRMRSISEALLHLRYHFPPTVVPKDKKLSKIQTLRLAIRYISGLGQVLQNADQDEHTRDTDSGHESPGNLSIKELKDSTVTLSPRSEDSTSSLCSSSSGKQDDFDDGFRSETEEESAEELC